MGSIRSNVHSDFTTVTNCLVATVIPPLLNKALKAITSVIASVGCLDVECAKAGPYAQLGIWYFVEQQ